MVDQKPSEEHVKDVHSIPPDQQTFFCSLPKATQNHTRIQNMVFESVFPYVNGYDRSRSDLALGTSKEKFFIVRSLKRGIRFS